MPSIQTRTLEGLLREGDRAVTNRTRIIPFRSVIRSGRLPLGTHVFSGFGISSRATREFACQLWRQLSAVTPPLKLLNDPNKVLTRYELLKRLSEEGINAFRACRVEEFADQSLKFPLFLRSDRQHTGSLTPVLTNHEEMAKALLILRQRRVPIDDVLAVEFCDTRGQDGLFRRFGVMRVGDALVPTSMIFSSEWVTKSFPKKLTPNDPHIEALIAEENAYVQKSPWRDVLWRAFEIANIDFGRMDFGVLDGKPQIWEINTAPQFHASDVGRRRDDWGYPLRKESRSLFYERLFAALLAIDSPGQKGHVAVSFDSALTTKVARDEAASLRSFAWIGAVKRLGRRWPRTIPFQLVRILFRRPFWTAVHKSENRRHEG